MTATRSASSFGPGPAVLRRRRVRLDNIALVPASALPFRAQWQAIADSLPAGDALLVVPTSETPLKRALRRVVPQLRAGGRHVTTIDAERFA